MNKVALITGTGMDSKTLASILSSKGYKVILSYRRNSDKKIDEIKSLLNDPNLDFEFCDITDEGSVNNLISLVLGKYGKIDELYSLAAMSHVGDSFKHPHYTLQATGLSVFYLLEAVRKLTPNTKVYQASTSEMFGGDPKNGPFDENSSFELRSPYSIAKGLAYSWVKYYRQTYDMFVASGFLFNHSNELRSPDFFIRKVTSSAARIALGKQDYLVVGNIDHYRDEHYSDYGCEAMWKMLQLDEPEDFVIGNGRANHGEEYLEYAFSSFNLDWRRYVKTDKSLYRPNEVVKLVSNPQKAIEKLSWNPNVISFKEHIGRMCKYDYFLENGGNPYFSSVLKEKT